jgi:predicted phosphodiesterase
MKPVWIWIILALAAVGLVWGLKTQQQASIRSKYPATLASRKGPYLLYPGENTQMMVLWQLETTAPCTLEWGIDATYTAGHEVTSEINSDHQHCHTITGLEPNTTYFYRVAAGETSYAGTFRAAPLEGETSVSFLVHSDTQTYPLLHDGVCGAMLSIIRTDPTYQTFVLHAGDWVEDGDREADWDQQFFCRACSSTRELQAAVPILGCMGNHDGSGELFSKYWPYPFVADHYWSFDYGPVHIAIVDQYADYRPGSAQYEWLKQDLRESARPWKVVLLHEPGWSAGHHPNNVAVQEYLQPLFEAYDVAMVCAGHNHYYARCEMNGVWYITTGGGGAPLYSPDPNQPAYVVTAINRRHFCAVEIQGDRLTLNAVGEDGAILDTFSINR